MFLVGLELNPKELYAHGEATVLMSNVSIVIPVRAGVIAFLFNLYPRLSDDSVSFMNFALFMGAAMAITAFPVLARILADLQLLRSRLGNHRDRMRRRGRCERLCAFLAYIVVLIRRGSLR